MKRPFARRRTGVFGCKGPCWATWILGTARRSVFCGAGFVPSPTTAFVYQRPQRLNVLAFVTPWRRNG